MELFAELFLATILLETRSTTNKVDAEFKLHRVFQKMAEAPQLALDCQELIQKAVKTSDLVQNAEDAAYLQWAGEIVIQALRGSTETDKASRQVSATENLF